MIEHKNDKITTTRDTKQEKLSRWEDIRFQDLFETVSIRRDTSVAWDSVPYGSCATANALSPFCVLVDVPCVLWYDEKGVIRCRTSDWSLWWFGFNF